MIRINIPSNDLKSVGYDPSQRILEIELLPAVIIQYSKVPERIYTGLLNSKSYRAYYINKIKYIYPCKRIE